MPENPAIEPVDQGDQLARRWRTYLVWFAPFVAGVGNMYYSHFAAYNIIGGLSWVTLFLALGYVFGNIPFVKRNFELVTIGIVLVSVLPMVLEVLKARREGKR